MFFFSISKRTVTDSDLEFKDQNKLRVMIFIIVY
jgi:hypothetical protein